MARGRQFASVGEQERRSSLQCAFEPGTAAPCWLASSIAAKVDLFACGSVIREQTLRYELIAFAAAERFVDSVDMLPASSYFGHNVDAFRE